MDVFFVRSLDGRSCKDEIYRMGIGAGYCEGNLNFATASEDDEVYTKKKVSRVSFKNKPPHKVCSKRNCSFTRFTCEEPEGHRARCVARGTGI